VLHFQHTYYLYGLALLPAFGYLFYLILSWKKRVRTRIGDPALVDQLTRNYSPRNFAVKFGLALGALALMILGLANLQHKTGGKVSRKGLDVMILLDVSNSMLAGDLQPSRLARAKQVISRLLDDIPDDRVGLIIFAGHAYLNMPLSSDHAAAKMYLDAASPASVPTQGTSIGEALQMAQTMFNNKEKKYKAVVLITDGEDHDENAAKVATQLHNEGVVLHTIGLGSPTGSFIVDPNTGEDKKDAEGNAVVTKLNQPLLQDLAGKTGGTYQLYDNTDAVVGNLEKALNDMGGQSYEDDNYAQYDSYFFYFLWGALVVLLVEWCIPEKRQKPAAV
jgi:Ca-activated chloride channel family protein